MIESDLIETLLENLSDRSKEEHNVKILRLVREVATAPLDKAVEMFECLQYEFVKFVCTEPKASRPDQTSFYEITNPKTHQRVVLLPRGTNYDCTCSRYFRSLLGQGNRFCEHVISLTMMTRFKDVQRVRQVELNLLDFTNELKSKVII